MLDNMLDKGWDEFSFSDKAKTWRFLIVEVRSLRNLKLAAKSGNLCKTSKQGGSMGGLKMSRHSLTSYRPPCPAAGNAREAGGAAPTGLLQKRGLHSTAQGRKCLPTYQTMNNNCCLQDGTPICKVSLISQWRRRPDLEAPVYQLAAIFCRVGTKNTTKASLKNPSPVPLSLQLRKHHSPVDRSQAHCCSFLSHLPTTLLFWSKLLRKAP